MIKHALSHFFAEPRRDGEYKLEGVDQVTARRA